MPSRSIGMQDAGRAAHAEGAVRRASRPARKSLVRRNGGGDEDRRTHPNDAPCLRSGAKVRGRGVDGGDERRGLRRRQRARSHQSRRGRTRSTVGQGLGPQERAASRETIACRRCASSSGGPPKPGSDRAPPPAGACPIDRAGRPCRAFFRNRRAARRQPPLRRKQPPRRRRRKFPWCSRRSKP